MATRTPRIFGLAVLASLALAIGAAPSAHAVPLFEADEYPATIDGSTIEAASVYTFGGIYQFECEEAPFQGSLSAAASGLTLAAIYEECSWIWPVKETPPPPSAVQITMNGCDYRFHSLELVTKDEYLALADLECPAGKQVVIELHEQTPIICTLTVPAQSNNADVKLIDLTGKEGTSDDTVKAQITIEGLHFTQDSLFTCPLNPGTYENLQYLGISTLTATKGGKQIGLRVSGE